MYQSPHVLPILHAPTLTMDITQVSAYFTALPSIQWQRVSPCRGGLVAAGIIRREGLVGRTGQRRVDDNTP